MDVRPWARECPIDTKVPARACARGARSYDERMPYAPRPKKRVGLVLGAGGPVGHAFHAGVLSALGDVAGWDARTADLVVGTSAGAQVGALLRAGVSARDLALRASGGHPVDGGHSVLRHYVRPCTKSPDPSLPRSSRPSSMRYFASALRAPSRLRPGRIVSALLPPGRVRLEPQADGLRNVFGGEWPERDLWITAVHLDSGERVAFGAPGAPSIDVGTAVTCSGAVPSVHAPVLWEGKRYVDGGMASATHLDLLLEKDLDVAVVSAPLSMFSTMRTLLRREVRRLERRMAVWVIEPRGEVLSIMGKSPMDLDRAARVAPAVHRALRDEMEQHATLLS